MNRSNDRFTQRHRSHTEEPTQILPRSDERVDDSTRRRPCRARRDHRLFDALLWTTCLGVIIGVLAANRDLLVGKRVGGFDLRALNPWQSRPFDGKQRVSVLIMGTDDKIEQGRSDTMMLANVNLPEKKVVLLSIPRDSRVRIPGHGVDRINSAYFLGGAPLARAAVEELLGRPVDYYVKTDFDGFQKIVDMLGGIDMDVEKRMVYRDREQKLYINLRPGRQRLRGYDAMGYVRFRHDRMGDLGRIKRQQNFAYAVLHRMMQPTMLPKLPFVLNAMRQYVHTDLSPQEFWALAQLAHGLDQRNLYTATVPGRPVMIGGKSLWEVDSYKTAQLLASCDSRLAPKGPTRVHENEPISVCVLNGSGMPGAANAVAKQLSAVGFKVTRTGNADSFGYKDSRIIDHTTTGEKAERVRDVLRCGAILPQRETDDSKTDVTVILGKDYRGA